MLLPFKSYAFRGQNLCFCNVFYIILKINYLQTLFSSVFFRFLFLLFHVFQFYAISVYHKHLCVGKRA